MMLPQPFAITKIGPIALFVQDLEAVLDFYVDSLGFKVTEEGGYRGYRSVFLGHGAEHHSLDLFPRALRQELGCRRLTWLRSPAPK
jgi:catechol 2,3-dioxygenase-like lactoylglutathione lyase family enzyme